MNPDSCYTPACPRRNTCTLWHTALTEVQATKLRLVITNPNIIEQAGGYDHCPCYDEYELKRFARGLAWTYQEMTVAQLNAVREALIRHFGYSTTVRLRCGYDAISPKEQAVIASIFEQLAPGVSPQYKAFEEHYIKPPRVKGRKRRNRWNRT